MKESFILNRCLLHSLYWLVHLFLINENNSLRLVLGKYKDLKYVKESYSRICFFNGKQEIV